MKRKILILLAILAVMCWAGTVSANSYDLIGNGATTGLINLPGIASGGFSSNATATFTLDLTDDSKPQLIILFTNADPKDTAGSEEVLAALFWTSSQTAIGSGSASGFLVPQDANTTISSFWGYGHSGLVGFNGTTAGNQGVGAVGLGYVFTPLDGSNSNNIDGLGYSLIAESHANPPNYNYPNSITDLKNHEPYVEPTVTIVLDLPVGTTHYAFSNPTAWWGTEHTTSVVPVPPRGAAAMLGPPGPGSL